MDLDAGHALAERRVQVWRQADAGYADQHQLPLEQRTIGLPLQHVEGGDEAFRRMAGEVGPEAAVASVGTARLPIDTASTAPPAASGSTPVLNNA
ncbi:MAG: hypothetical protein U5L03_04175 [Burkholderiaceae bacterium]|nr:hypothetical protein [Burkholderiaceae bacterium]